ncbi:cob(I)yrinic acid a,c-diamide adenosyltransferase [Paenibacillus sp. N3.4]|uniref:cob(I)yrinic acid a,c-diamide adenosyltransferase n=1 Tax=Paenibacillus sp. N3.4 TaxID=2603222 RepID=UPI0011CB8B88|nr:cob(I)yrinic acid a,c-diamide adenosyltransferase [Paenibacillus sp. N3.4]TXK85912.1 cob(I)yrinic acid a,c-diamide adenosyltransferase [Paenibacillus sp. N3.4]
MKIYTKSGDQGKTSLVYGQRVSKHSPRVEAYGTCDEANSMIGLAISTLPQGEQWSDFLSIFRVIQTKLFHVGAELATPTGKKVEWPVVEQDVLYLEEQIDNMEASLSPLSNFILPGGHISGASLHVARTIVRRAERIIVQVQMEEEINPIVVKYVNRLSDFLFVAARFVNHRLGSPELTLHQE